MEWRRVKRRAGLLSVRKWYPNIYTPLAVAHEPTNYQRNESRGEDAGGCNTINRADVWVDSEWLPDGFFDNRS